MTDTGSLLQRMNGTRERAEAASFRDERTAAVIGAALGIAFAVCFATGLLSHLIQDPPSWFEWPARPAGLYRITQGVHVVAGIASIPLVLAKLWVVHPKLFAWPPVRDLAHLVERLLLLPLVGGSLLVLFTGLSNINIWRPWPFSFRSGHLWISVITMGALICHLGAKWVVANAALRRGPTPRGSDSGGSDSGDPDSDDPDPDDPDSGDSGADAGDRRAFLATTFAVSVGLALTTAGQTVEPLARLALLAPRRPDVGPQGFPVNRTARSVGLESVDADAYRLIVDGPAVSERLELTLADLRALPQTEATLPIACVEGWSASRSWRGVAVRDLVDLAGVDPDRAVEGQVVSLQRSRRQKRGPLSASHIRDRHTMLALEVEGEVLHPDHGFPVRLIGPNRPGVHQTKWVGRLELR